MEEKIMSLVNITKELTNKEEGMNAAETSQCLDSYEELVTILMSERASYKEALEAHAAEKNEEIKALKEELEQYKRWWQEDRQGLLDATRSRLKLAAEVRDIAYLFIGAAKRELGDNFDKATHAI